MKISEETVKQVAKLARLQISEKEAAVFAPQLSTILEYADQLQQVDLTDIPLTSHPFSTFNVMRRDEPSPSTAKAFMLACAPDEDGNQVRVPAVLEG